MDARKVLPALNHPDESLMRKALQRLRIRWWHAAAEQLQNILRAAGAHSHAVNMVHAVVSA